MKTRMFPVLLALVACQPTSASTDTARALSITPAYVRSTAGGRIVTGIVDVEAKNAGKVTRFQQWFSAVIGLTDDSAHTRTGDGQLLALDRNVDLNGGAYFIDTGNGSLVFAPPNDDPRGVSLPCADANIPLGAISGATVALAYTGCGGDGAGRLFLIGTDLETAAVETFGAVVPQLLVGSDTHVALVTRQSITIHAHDGTVKRALPRNDDETPILGALAPDLRFYRLSATGGPLTLRAVDPMGNEVTLALVQKTPLALEATTDAALLLTDDGRITRYPASGGAPTEYLVEAGAWVNTMGVSSDGQIDVVGTIDERTLVLWHLSPQGQVTDRKELDPLRLSIAN